jgi:hypothetical protein
MPRTTSLYWRVARYTEEQAIKETRTAAPRRTGVRRGRGVMAGVEEYKAIHWLVGENARDMLPG